MTPALARLSASVIEVIWATNTALPVTLVEAKLNVSE